MEKMKVILDTDLGCDSDDIGAMCILHNLNKQGLIHILGITSVNSNIEPALVIDAINNHYGTNLLVGMNKANDYGINNGYALDIVNEYKLNKKEFRSSTDVLIELLSNNDNVTLITVGPLTNIATLVQDEEGCRLINEKVNIIYSMAGNFISDNAEWNITEDIQSAQLVLKKYKGNLVFVPYEVGADVYTNRNLLNSDTLMGYGYYVHNKGPRQSWDPITVYYAITLSNQFRLSEKGTISIDNNGVTTFECNNGKHQFMLNDFDKERVEKLLEEVMIP